MTDFRILITGSRDWVDEEAISSAIFAALVTAGRLDPPPDRVIVVHGAARGADILAERVADRWQIPTEAHPKERYRSPRERNQAMVDLGADICLAFAQSWASGTGMCARMARRAGIPTVDHGVSTQAEVRQA